VLRECVAKRGIRKVIIPPTALAVETGRGDFFELDGDGGRVSEPRLVKLDGGGDGVFDGCGVDVIGDGGVERRDDSERRR